MFIDLLESLSNHFIPVDPKVSLFSKYSQIVPIMKLKTQKILSFIYSNRNDIHNILYENDQIIKLDSKSAECGLPYLFYVLLLIKYQSDLVNYMYEIDFIEKVNNIRKETKNSLTNFILAIIIIELVNNYKSTELYDEYNEQENEILNQICEENQNIKFKVTDELKRMNLKISQDCIEDNMISEIYIDIIESLIENKKLDDFDFCSNILNQMGLNEIELTENIYNKLKEIFDNNEEYTNEYQLSRLDDLFNENKLNFYMTIFNYIFKSSFYTYNISFLISARNRFLKIIKNEPRNKLLENINRQNNQNIKDKLFYIITKFCDSKYYFDKYLNSNLIGIMEILNYYKDFYFTKKEKEITEIENFVNNNNNLNEKDLKNYLNDLTDAQYFNERKNIIYFLLEEQNGKFNKNKKGAQKLVEKYMKKMKDCEKMIRDGKFKKKMRKDDKRILYRYFDDKNNHNYISKIFSERLMDTFIQDIKSDKEIFDYANKESNFVKDMYKITNNKEENSTEDSENTIEIRKIIKKIETHQESVESIIKTKDGFYVSLSEQCLNLFDSSYEKILELKNNGIYTGLQEMEKIEENDKIELVATTEEEISIIKINKKNLKSKIESNKIYNSNHKSCMSIDNRNHIILCKEGVYHIKDFFSKITYPTTHKISEINCVGSIRISEDLVAITSNINIEGGEDKIIFYNPCTGKIINEIEGYSFINSMNGLNILTCESGSGALKKMLLCSCKKNELLQEKNGILLIDVEKIQNSKEKNNDNYIKFFETGNLEVYSFCPLLNKDKKTTNYFLVGGYDTNKKNGEILSYKYIKDKNQKDEIKFVSFLEFKDILKGENKAIKCIIQTNDEKILFTCSDGNLYLFLQSELLFDEKTKKENEENDWIFLKTLKS